MADAPEWMALPLGLPWPPPDPMEVEPAERRDSALGAVELVPDKGGDASASLDALIDRISRHFSVAPCEIARGARHERATRARAVIAFVGVVRRGIPIAQVAARLGVPRQAIGKAIARGGRLVREEEPTPLGWG